MENASIDKQALHEVGLRYVSCRGKGYTRLHSGRGFSYIDQTGNPIQNTKVLSRIRGLVIPPAWQQVWICPSAQGHIQATGIDGRGRKQYRYHPLWSQLRSRDKFASLYLFGKRMAQLDRRITRDLKQKTFTKERVCALALAIMSKTYFRIGNSVYEKENKSYGLTTLRNRHVQQVSSHKVFFRFVGKKGIQHQRYLQEKSLVRLLSKVKEIPGQRLFQYYNHEGKAIPLESGDLNGYLKETLDIDLTCKSFRTWYGCILFLHYLGHSDHPNSESLRKQELLKAIDAVAEQLGNTRTVTRQHYIHPLIQESYISGILDPWIKRMRKRAAIQPADPLYKRKLMQLLGRRVMPSD